MNVRDRIIELRRVPASELVADPRNYRRHSNAQRSALRAVLREVGVADVAIVREQDGKLILIDGHLRTDELDEVPVLVLDVDEREAGILLATLDPLAAMATHDAAAAEELVATLQAKDEELRALLQALHVEPAPPEAEDPEAPVQDVPARTKPGDLWLLGEHRLLCGDCRNAGDVERLVAGRTINVAFTSPPYADRRKYDETTAFRPIPPEEYVEWFAPVAGLVADHLAEDGSWFVNIKAGAEGLDTHLYVLDLVIAHVRQWDWHFATEFCWERSGSPGKPARRFKNQFEPVYQFARGDWKFRPDAVRHASDAVPVYDSTNNVVFERVQGRPGDPFRRRRKNRSTANMAAMQGTGADVGDAVVEGLAYPGNRLPTFAGSHQATGHAAAFPVGLPAWFLEAFSDPGDVVYDPFVGSGSTILAARQAGRQGLGMEISPAYVDQAVARWERLSGEQAQLEPPE